MKDPSTRGGGHEGVDRLEAPSAGAEGRRSGGLTSRYATPDDWKVLLASLLTEKREAIDSIPISMTSDLRIGGTPRNRSLPEETVEGRTEASPARAVPSRSRPHDGVVGRSRSGCGFGRSSQRCP
jgi:hypothetical protein